MADTSQTPTASAPSIDDFVNRLIEEKGYPELTDAVREQIEKDLLVRLNDTINARVIAAMSDEGVKGFSELLDKNPSQGEIQDYISKNIPDGASFLAKVLLDFRKSYLGLG